MKTSRMRDINHLPRVPRYHISNFNGLLSGTFCTAVTRTPRSRASARSPRQLYRPQCQMRLGSNRAASSLHG